MGALAKELVKRIDWQDDQSLLWAIEHLRHDEHVDAATLSGILNYAFCIQLSDSGGNPSIEKQAYDADRQARWPLSPTDTAAASLIGSRRRRLWIKLELGRLARPVNVY